MFYTRRMLYRDLNSYITIQKIDYGLRKYFISVKYVRHEIFVRPLHVPPLCTHKFVSTKIYRIAPVTPVVLASLSTRYVTLKFLYLVTIL